MNATTTILQVIYNAQPSRVLVTSLRSECRITAGLGDADFKAACRDLLSAKLIEAEEDSLTRDTYYVITPQGEARIRGTR